MDGVSRLQAGAKLCECWNLIKKPLVLNTQYNRVPMKSPISNQRFLNQVLTLKCAASMSQETAVAEDQVSDNSQSEAHTTVHDLKPVSPRIPFHTQHRPGTT